MDYDALIVGGGIQGVGIAQAAAAAGWRVALLERDALAAGTSRASSKLIHGGLRYLENMRLGLVHESLRERSLLLQLAPELVHRVAFHIPIHQDSHRRPWQIRIGLGMYAVLAGLDADSRFSRIPHREWRSLDGLRTEGLQAVFRYMDAQTDDAALTRAVMHSAMTLGAELHLPARFTAAELRPDGIEVRWEADGRAHTATARVLVNAAGPWVNGILAAITPRQAPLPVDLVRGSHIMLDASLDRGAYYLEAPQDDRAVFAMPWQDRTLVGTTEAIHRDGPDRVAASDDEIRYLREVAAHYFPRLANAGLVDQFAGLRVLPAATDRPFTRSRETLWQLDRPTKPRLLSVAGGKLTTWRASAAHAIRVLGESVPARPPQADTRQFPIHPAPEDRR